MPPLNATCPQCQLPVEKDAPRPGDFYVCDGCSFASRYTDTLELEPIAGEDLNRFPWLRRVQHLIRVDRHGATLA